MASVLTFIFYMCAPFCLLHHASAAPGIFASGDGDGIEFAEDRVSCDECISSIEARLNRRGHPHCNEVARLTECFESCSLPISTGGDPLSLAELALLSKVTKIFSILRLRDCQVFEDNAPGCNDDVLTCLDPIARVGRAGNSLNSINCTDDAYVSLLQCTGNSPDCEWRSHIEMIASRARRSVCGRSDRCIAGGILFITNSSCDKFKMVPLNNLSSAPTAAEQPTAGGTKFDTRICRLQHASAVSC